MAKAEQKFYPQIQTFLKQCLEVYRYRQNKEYTYLEATVMRILFVSFLLLTSKACQPKQPLPLGLAQYMDLSPFCVSDTFDIIQPVFLFFCIMYSFGQLKLISIGFLLFFVVCTNTVNNSGGAVYHGNQLPGMILLVQFIGQLRFTFDKYILRNRQNPLENDGKQIWWTQQVLAGAYLVCALTKQILTGGQWLQRAKFLAMGLLSINERAVVTFGSGGSALTPGLIDYLLVHPILCSWFFAPGFIFEFIFPIFLYNRFTLLAGGIMLITMHLLINYFMRLEFGAFKIVLLAYCINVPFWIRFIQDLIQLRNGKTIQQIQREEDQELEERGSPVPIPKALPKDKPSRSWKSILLQIWNKTPLKVMIFIVVTCLLVKEFFPFSNFPMFGAPRDITGYFQVRTKDDVVLTQLEYFSWTLAKVSKFFRSYCKDRFGADWVESKKKEFACGNHTLDSLMKIRAISSKRDFLNSNLPLKLIKVEFVYNHENNTISRSERLVGLYP